MEIGWEEGNQFGMELRGAKVCYMRSGKRARE